MRTMFLTLLSAWFIAMCLVLRAIFRCMTAKPVNHRAHTLGRWLAFHRSIR